MALSENNGHLPSGRCGLKYREPTADHGIIGSPPFGEVWIEIDTKREGQWHAAVTSLRGGVD